MPRGKTHIKINLVLALPMGLIILFFAFKPTLTTIIIFTLSLLYNTVVFNPDLDIARYVKPLSLKGILYFPFIPYSWIFRHRGISHALFVGTITRLLYLFLLTFLVCILWQFADSGITFEFESLAETLKYGKYNQNHLLQLFAFLNTKKYILLTVTSAFVYGDLWHIVLDRCLD
ncbi:MAG: DUF2227 family putative metal-binding protein [Oligoflexia bacterium]|nr:DUF2227 family putative metal-binding protein [Oligoflexia bacterium]